MMQRLAADPAFWGWLMAFVGLLFTAAGALLGLVIAWARAKTAEYEARSAKEAAAAAIVGQGLQQQTLVQHTAAIAALQATTQATGERRGATEALAQPASQTSPEPVQPEGLSPLASRLSPAGEGGTALGPPPPPSSSAERGG